MYFQGDYEIVPDAAISTFFEIGTEILVSSKPLAEMRSVAFSRMPDTSRVILEVALRELFPEIPYRFEIGTGNPFKDLESCDASVVTGEGAFGLPDDYHLYNVGEFWVRLTELPAVFYLWLVPAELPVPAKQRAYAHVMLAKKTGLAKIDKVVRLAQERVTLNRYRMIEYLTVELDYDLFIKQVKSLKILGEYMSSFKLIQEEKRRDLVFATQRSHVSVFEEVFGAGDVSIDDIVLDFDLDDEEIRVDSVDLGNNHVILGIAGRRLVFHGKNTRDKVYVSGPSGDATFLKVRAGAGAASEEAGSLTAPMAGQVLKVVVSPGDAVQKGARLMILEAMKMEHDIIAPVAGTVTKVHFDEGAKCQQGDLLVEIEEVEPQ